jgi:acetyltransferase-like isoleucine patch superfamily enzyme
MLKNVMGLINRFFFKMAQPDLIQKLLLKLDSSKADYIRSQFKCVGDNCVIPSSAFINNPKYISIGNNFGAWYNLRMEAIDAYMQQKFCPIISIGNNVNIGSDFHIGCINRISIGNNVLIAGRVFITDHFHGSISSNDIHLVPTERELYSKGPVEILDNVWIGEGVCIMPGVTIGANSIIGANSVVTKSFGQNSVIAGNPAKLIKYL